MSNPNALINSEYGPIIINIHDSVIGKHISTTGYWAQDDIELMKNLLNFLLSKKSHLTVYDVGANIGTHSLAFAKTYADKITVHAFEAQRQIFNMLCGTIALNGLRNVVCHHFAVSDGSQTRIEIPIPAYDRANNFGALELMQPQRSDMQDMAIDFYESIETITLDSLNHDVDFIKIDIEGMEDKAFRGALGLLQRSRPICFIEIHKTDHRFIFELFKSLDYIGFLKRNLDLIAIPKEHMIQVNDLDRVF